MYELTIKDSAGSSVGTLGVDPKRLGERVRTRLLQEACIMFENNQRVGTHCTKDRSTLISFSNRKPWRQKGTGRARSGTRRSPIWRKGATIFGPKPKDYGYGMNKKMRWRAVQSAILSKIRDGEVVVLDKLALAAPKTKQVAKLLEAVGVKSSVLIVLPAHDETFLRAARNIPTVQVAPVKDLNAYAVLHQKQLLVSRAALDEMLATYGEEG
jgi:large subunit ribosomal protein L4